MKLSTTPQIISATLFFTLTILVLFVTTSCGSSSGDFVINELMASNKTGIVSNDGRLYGWIEIKNISGSSASLSGYSLEKDSGEVSWDFPDVTLESGECILVFTTSNTLDRQLSCGFDLSTKGGNVQLKNRWGSVISEVNYDQLKDDRAIKYTKKGEYEKTYEQSPGFSNGEEGRKQYLEFISKQRRNDLLIWEYASKVPNDGENQPWIELKNTSDQPISLAEYAITDDMKEPGKISLPQQQLAPGQFYIFTDRDGRLKGESVILTKNKRFVDGVCGAQTYIKTTTGRTLKSKVFQFFESATPNSENTVPGYETIAKKPKLTPEPGVYSKSSIKIGFKDQGTTIHYTLDGSMPTKSSPVYKDSITISKSTIVKAFAEDSACLPSQTITSTYLVNIKHTLPIICITVDNEDLHNFNTGIYEAGPGASAAFPHKGANYWKDWEKSAHIEFFDGKEGFSYDCGLKIFGGFSRALPKKSWRIKFHDYYGESRLKYDLYNRGKIDKYKSFVLRSGSQDYTGVMVRDEFFTSLMAEKCPTLHTQAYRPVILYLNTEYFGIYYIREKINAEFVANHLNVEKDSTTLIFAQHNPMVGTDKEYRELVNYALSHDMNDSKVYEYMKSKVEFQSLIDEKIGQFYASNTDAGNIRYFKSSDPKGNQKWHWIYYDLDATYACVKPLSFYIEGNTLIAGAGSVAPYNVLICQLLKNKDFRKMFLERWAFHLKNTFSKANAVGVFDRLIKTIEPEMQQECKRWPEMSYEQWKKNVEKFRQKIIERNDTLHKILLRDLSVTPQEQKQYFK